MTDILLIQPPVRDFYLTVKRTIPYGLACIAAALLEKGFSVDIIDGLATSKSRVVDLPEEMHYLRRYYTGPDRSPFALFFDYRHFGFSFEHIGRTARKSGAPVVGVSALFTPYVRESLAVAEAVKRFHPDCKIVVGGHHPTSLPESVLEHPVVDFVLRGEGEVSMPILAEALRAGTPFDRVPGIAFRKMDGTLHIGQPVEMKHPDRYPLPATHLVNHSFYRRKNRASAVVTASRGCPLKCTYCSVGAHAGPGYRKRSPESVIEEIARAADRAELGFVDFEDENLSFDKRWFLRLLEQIRNRFDGDGPELRAMNGLLPSTLDEETVSAMADAGFKTLNLSLATTSRPALDRFRRPDVCDAFDRVLDLAEKYGLNAVGYVIAGAPFQDAEASLSDLLFLAARRVLAGVSAFYPAPGSPDYRRCEKLGLLPPSFSLMRSSALPVSHTTSRKELVTLLRLGRIVNFMKYLKDRGKTRGTVSKPNPAGDRSQERVAVGEKLLDMFLADGRIRGVTPEGEIFEHPISIGLAKRFVRELEGIRLRGTL